MVTGKRRCITGFLWDREVKMKKTLFFILIFLLCSLSYAKFFSHEINFFGSTQTETKIIKTIQKKKPVISIWAQPIVMPDGSVQMYVPPPQVMNFLNKPTPQNAKVYLAWEKERINKIAKATAILQSITKVSTANKPLFVNSLPKSTSQPFSSPVILYFAKQGCKYCAADDMVMDLFNKRYKNNIRIIGFWVGSKTSMPDLSFSFHLANGIEKKFRIGLYPAMIFYLPNKSEPVKLEGFITGNQLIQFYQKIGGVL